jgi:hypothetical protein
LEIVMLKLNMHRIRRSDSPSEAAQGLAKTWMPRTDSEALAGAIEARAAFLRRMSESEEMLQRFFAARYKHRAAIDYQALMQRLGVGMDVSAK